MPPIFPPLEPRWLRVYPGMPLGKGGQRQVIRLPPAPGPSRRRLIRPWQRIIVYKSDPHDFCSVRSENYTTKFLMASGLGTLPDWSLSCPCPDRRQRILRFQALAVLRHRTPCLIWRNPRPGGGPFLVPVCSSLESGQLFRLCRSQNTAESDSQISSGVMVLTSRGIRLAL